MSERVQMECDGGWKKCEGKGERNVWLNINCFQKTSSFLPVIIRHKGKCRVHRRVLSIAPNDERLIVVIQTRVQPSYHRRGVK